MNASKSVSLDKLSANETRDGSLKAGDHTVAVEVPVVVAFNGVSFSVMMATPENLKDFALGFALSEQLIHNSQEITDIDIRRAEKGLIVDLSVAPEVVEGRMKGRNLVGRAGCGLCGVEEIDAAFLPLTKITKAPMFDPTEIFKSLKAIRHHQPLNKETGCMHAAALVGEGGDILLAREDVGRHNALDKLIGAAKKDDISLDKGFVLLTSRCSYELVQKSIVAGVRALVTISAPTSLAIDIAKENNLTLIALARDDSLLCANDPFNIMTGL
jgi:FdhD protein